MTPDATHDAARHADEASAIRAAEDVFLDPAQCPACVHCAKLGEQFFRWFDGQTSAEPAMWLRLRDSVGFCPEHERRALRHPTLPPLPFVVRGAMARLDPQSPPRGECPACERARQAREGADELLARAVADAGLRARYAARLHGACLPHVAATIASGDSGLARVLAAQLRGELASDGTFETVAGRDDDAPTRVALRAALLVAVREIASSSAESECATWSVDACPACSAGGHAEKRYLEWRRHEERADASDLRTDPGVLCAAHLHDLAADDPEAGERAAARVRRAWVERLDRALERWPEPQGRRRGEASAAVRVKPGVCPACRAREIAEERHLDLTLRLLGRRAYARRYEASHGLCLRHVELAGETVLAPFLRDLLRAQLDALDWEIAEAHRKHAWDARHERPGPERTAPLRLAALIDGRTFLGGPAAAIE
jgi:hypothetical protein